MKVQDRRGAELKVGDTIAVWWRPGRDHIIRLEPYQGRLAYLFPKGAQLAYFALCHSGMTIDNDDVYSVVVTEETP
jgi:hypothetical protein